MGLKTETLSGYLRVKEWNIIKHNKIKFGLLDRLKPLIIEDCRRLINSLLILHPCKIWQIKSFICDF